MKPHLNVDWSFYNDTNGTMATLITSCFPVATLLVRVILCAEHTNLGLAGCCIAQWSTASVTLHFAGDVCPAWGALYVSPRWI